MFCCFDRLFYYYVILYSYCSDVDRFFYPFTFPISFLQAVLALSTWLTSRWPCRGPVVALRSIGGSKRKKGNERVEKTDNTLYCCGLSVLHCDDDCFLSKKDAIHGITFVTIGKRKRVSAGVVTHLVRARCFLQPPPSVRLTLWCWAGCYDVNIVILTSL